MTQKGHAVVEALLAHHRGLIGAIVSARDPAVEKDWHDEIAALAKAAGVAFFERREHARIDTGHAIAVSWRWLIDAGDATLVVMHDSLLPRYRGFNPLVTALINGDTQIGVTALLAAAEYDRGDIVAQARVDVAYPIRIQEAIDLVEPLYCRLALDIAARLEAGGGLETVPQCEAHASYSLWRDEDDYLIDWNDDAQRIRRFIDATGPPYKGATAWMRERRVRVLRARALPDVPIANRTPGKVIFLREGLPVVVCGTGLLELGEVVDEETRASLLPLTALRVRFAARKPD